MKFIDRKKFAMKEIAELNNARLGSFGEWIFEYSYEFTFHDKPQKVHKERTDFRVNNKAIDVKATRRFLTKELPKEPKYYGPKEKGIQYAIVEFYVGGVRVSLNGDVFALLNWELVEKEFIEWKSRTKQYTTKKKQATTKISKEISNAIKNIGSKFNFETRIIYRTIQKEFGFESPDNLLPSKPKENRITVFLDFSKPKTVEMNIRTIYAFPEKMGTDFPLLLNPRLSKQKIDLTKIPPRYVFASLSEFEAKFERILRID